MGRLENIIERNRNPRAHRRGMTASVGVGLFLLLIIILMMFTDLGLSKDAKEAVDAGPSPGRGRAVPVQLGTPGGK